MTSLLSNLATAVAGASTPTFAVGTLTSTASEFFVIPVSINVSGSAIQFDYSEEVQAVPATFNGYILSFNGAPPLSTVTVDQASTFMPVSLAHTATSVSVNAEGLTLMPSDKLILDVTFAPAASSGPSLLTLANLSKNIYTGSSGYEGFQFIADNCSVLPETCLDPGLDAGAYANASGSQIVMAVRGTEVQTQDLDERLALLADLDLDAQLLASNPPNPLFRETIGDAAAFVRAIRHQYPSAQITLTGHSLGGAIAQLVGKASGLPTYVFNAPGAEQLYAALQPELSGLTPPAGSQPVNVNYRLYGDQVSLVGEPVGSAITLQDPPDSMLPSGSQPSCYAAYELIPSAVRLHMIDTVIAQIEDDAPMVSPAGEPDLLLDLTRCRFNLF